MKNKYFIPVILGLIVLIMTGCFAEVHELEPCLAEGEKATFLLGLWHGFIAPISFILSLFSSSITVYEVNSGGWYLFGFLLGIGAFNAGGSRGVKRIRSSREDRES